MEYSSREKIYLDIHAAPGSIVITNADASIVYANNAVAERTGFDLPEMIGQNPAQLWGGNMEQSFYIDMWNVIKRQKKPFIAPIRNTSKQNNSLNQYIHVAPVLNEQNEVLFFIETQLPDKQLERESAYQASFNTVFSNPTDNSATAFQWLFAMLTNTELHATELYTSLSRTLDELLVQPTLRNYEYRYADRVLIQRAQESSSAFAALYEKYTEDIHRYFMCRTPNVSTAEDLTQETFLKAFRHISDFRITNASYQTYLRRIAHNVLVNYHRKRQPVHLDEQTQDTKRRYDQVEQTMVLEKVWKQLKQLTRIEQQIVTYYYQDDYSVREIATVMQKSENAVKLHLSRARKKLRKHFFEKN